MKKERVCNTFDAEVIDETHISMFGSEFEIPACTLESGSKVKAEVEFDGVELMDHVEDGTIGCEVHFILYKGDHYHLTIITTEGDHIYVDTQDVWDKGDLVGITIAPMDLKISRAAQPEQKSGSND